MKYRGLRITLLLIFIAMTLAGCAELHSSAVSSDGAGFFSGLWHGAIAPFAFVGRLFSDTIAVYESPNSGGWYDFGFLIGIGALFGGGGSSAAR